MGLAAGGAGQSVEGRLREQECFRRNSLGVDDFVFVKQKVKVGDAVASSVRDVSPVEKGLGGNENLAFAKQDLDCAVANQHTVLGRHFKRPRVAGAPVSKRIGAKRPSALRLRFTQPTQRLSTASKGCDKPPDFQRFNRLRPIWSFNMRTSRKAGNIVVVGVVFKVRCAFRVLLSR